jgi:hypothetical protein
MNKVLYQSMFVFLSALLLSALFVLTPTDDKDVVAFQNEIKNQVASAAVEVLGEQNYAEPFALIWSTINNFYYQAADETIALLQPDDEFINLALMFDSEYQLAVEIINQPVLARVIVPTEEALVNIIPMSEAELLIDPYFNEDLAYFEEYGGVVAGESTHVDENEQEFQAPAVVWTTINDSITGYPYCVGIFNATVNSYPGPCAEEDNFKIRQN